FFSRRGADLQKNINSGNILGAPEVRCARFLSQAGLSAALYAVFTATIPYFACCFITGGKEVVLYVKIIVDSFCFLG
ncbi:MAG: hypothetical protein IJT24_02730, partial [Lachnospiraceae bacterium]|nr:hypothetical protein [Lachnospiraceae bacterium]